MAVTTLTVGTCVKHMLQGIATHSVTDTTDDHKNCSQLEMMMTSEHRTLPISHKEAASICCHSNGRWLAKVCVIVSRLEGHSQG